MTHILVITEVDGERESELRHPDNCPTETHEGFDGKPVDCHVCAEQIEWNEGGPWCLGFDTLADMPLGEHKVEAWSSYTPSTPNGPEEWDGGLSFVNEE